MTTTAASNRSHRPATMTATVGQYDHAAAATYLMKHAGTTELAVLDGQQSNQPIACITETDIAEAMAQGEDLNEIRIRDLVARHAPFARLCKQVGRRIAETLAGRR